jgi:hypothetical protein
VAALFGSEDPAALALDSNARLLRVPGWLPSGLPLPLLLLNPGNATLQIGGLKDAIRESGVPGLSTKVSRLVRPCAGMGALLNFAHP